MGLTYSSGAFKAMNDVYKVDKKEDEFVIALAGNPNTGKSTVFNTLTGLKQHTGNWPGKTVVNATGKFSYRDKDFILVDLPGSYTLFAASIDEKVARDFICFGDADAVVVVIDGTCIERNMNLVYQITELYSNAILCINLIDEARKKGIEIEAKGIEKELGIPVILTAARSGIGIDDLKDAIYDLALNKVKTNIKEIEYPDEIEKIVQRIIHQLSELPSIINKRWLALRLFEGNYDFIKEIYGESDYLTLLIEKIKDICGNSSIAENKIRDVITETIYEKAKYIKSKYVHEVKSNRREFDIKIDNYLTSRWFGIPTMLLLLCVVFYITLQGANYPSKLLSYVLFGLEDKIFKSLAFIGIPNKINEMMVYGIYRTLAWVVSVMLPPMAIFFPLFTLLEDSGYLPRVAFNLDHTFKKACAHGKQSLTMCMGFGCNAAGIIACRIIESPRERLIAILTNNFVPCNGRFPTLFALAGVFFVVREGALKGIIPSIIVTLLVIIGVVTTFVLSFVLSKTLLKGVPSTFTLELPPYRKPQIGRVFYTSFIDRTIFVLGRAVSVAAPAGLVIWVFSNVMVGDVSLYTYCANFLNPLGRIMGLDGLILMAFILGFPANEIVIPILLMTYLSKGGMVDFENLEVLKSVLVQNGWTILTALNVMLFSIFHFPCATTLWTIFKETKSLKWTFLSAVIPTAIGILVCTFTNLIFKLIF